MRILNISHYKFNRKKVLYVDNFPSASRNDLYLCFKCNHEKNHIIASQFI